MKSVLLPLSMTVLLTVWPGGKSSKLFERSDDSPRWESVVMQQSQMISELQAKLASMETEITTLKSQIARQETKVAFNVRLAGDPARSFMGNEILVLDAVDLNIANSYDKVTGTFTAPVSGVYQFNLHISHVPPGSLHVKIYKNSHPVAEVEANGDEPKYHDRSANSVVLHLVHGDKVFVRRESYDSTVTSIVGGLQTSFSGVLIAPDSP